jgi:hypothetical protein
MAWARDKKAAVLGRYVNRYAASTLGDELNDPIHPPCLLDKLSVARVGHIDHGVSDRSAQGPRG